MTAHSNGHVAAAAENRDATMADAPVEGDGDGAALAKALAAVMGNMR